MKRSNVPGGDCYGGLFLKKRVAFYRGSKAFIIFKSFTLFVGILLSVRVNAVPHDLLKVVDWGRHASRKAVEGFFPRAGSKLFQLHFYRLLQEGFLSLQQPNYPRG